MVDQIAVLRQVFDYFDKDKTGQIDASEMDAVLCPKLGGGCNCYFQANSRSFPMLGETIPK